MNQKTCPLKVAAFWANPSDSEIITKGAASCSEHECAWWVITYTTEGLVTKGCAVEILAVKTSDGRVSV
jgi:hypothetical protein